MSAALLQMMAMGKASGGSAPAAPTKVQIVLQGQTAPGQSAYSASPNNAYNVPAPNDLTIAWKSSPTATSYDIYRSVDKGAYTLYAAGISAASAASAYSSYQSACTGAGYDYQDQVDCAYHDSAATNCVAQVSAPITNFVTPTWGTSHGYTYKVVANNANGSSAQSADSIMIFFAGGKKIMNAGLFNGTLNYTDATVLPASPTLGNTTAAKWTALAYVNAGNPGDPFINPYAGASACGDNCNVQGFTYVVLNIYNSTAGANFNLTPELEGDSTIITTAPYVDPTYTSLAVANTWKQIKIPIADLNTYNQGGGNNGVLFPQWYKMTMGTTVDCNYWVEYFFSVT